MKLVITKKPWNWDNTQVEIVLKFPFSNTLLAAKELPHDQVDLFVEAFQKGFRAACEEFGHALCVEEVVQ